MVQFSEIDIIGIFRQKNNNKGKIRRIELKLNYSIYLILYIICIYLAQIFI